MSGTAPAEPRTAPAPDSAAPERIGIAQRYWNRFVGFFRHWESAMAQDAKLRTLLHDLQQSLHQGKVKVHHFKGTPWWSAGWNSRPYGPVELQIGDRFYTLRKKLQDRSKSWEYRIKNTFTIKSDDGRFQLRYREHYGGYDGRLKAQDLVYRDDAMGRKLSSASRDVTQPAKNLFDSLMVLMKRHYDEQLDALGCQDKLPF